MGGVAHMSKFKNHAPRVLRKVREALGNTLVSFTNKTNSGMEPLSHLDLMLVLGLAMMRSSTGIWSSTFRFGDMLVHLSVA
ncbi:hypothetical protein L3X38_035293 [Prunus dulcis]|uniref:Uncharacterized protein n=1 Tax=Prunus dulcis TaxID=3755 RepID=A0AAD4VJE6_PRUDU|nr:hypothetical protein L3X38_035293 [Prunus dulcis]